MLKLRRGEEKTALRKILQDHGIGVLYEHPCRRGILGHMTARIDLLDKGEVVAETDTGVIVTAEEHNVIGGLGSAVAEVVAETVPVPVIRVGVEDAFGKSGPALEVLAAYGLDSASIAAKVKAAIALKK